MERFGEDARGWAHTPGMFLAIALAVGNALLPGPAVQAWNALRSRVSGTASVAGKSSALTCGGAPVIEDDGELATR